MMEGKSTKTLGLEWNTKSDEFCLTVNKVPPPDPCRVTKRALVSDIAKTFDVLGWFSPTIINTGSTRNEHFFCRTPFFEK